MVLSKLNKQSKPALKRGRDDEDSDDMPETKRNAILKDETTSEDENADSDDVGSEDDSQDEGDNDSEESEDSNEDDDDHKELKAKGKLIPVKSSSSNPVGVVKIINNNGLVIANLNTSVIPESFAKFVSEKSGIKDIQCFVTKLPCAFIVTKGKNDAAKIQEACQDVLYQNHAMQVSLISSGLVPNKSEESKKDEKSIEPTTHLFVYSFLSSLREQDFQKICPKASGIDKTKKGIYITFNDLQSAKEAFIKLSNMKNMHGTRFFVKYIRNNHMTQIHTGTELRLHVYNVPFNTPANQVKELAPKATWFHANPSAPGSYIFEFSDAKACSDAGKRMQGYNLNGRQLKTWYPPNNLLDIKINAFNAINDAKLAFKKMFPESVDFKVNSWMQKNVRKPQFLIIFDKRDAWERAVRKAADTHTISNVKVALPNFSMMGKKDEDDIQKQEPSKKKQSVKVQPVKNDSDDNDLESEEESDGEAVAMETDEDDGDSEEDDSEEGDDSEEENDSQDGDDDDESEEEIKKPVPVKKQAPQNGFKKPNGPGKSQQKQAATFNKKGKFNPKFKK